uniref:Uncharacterized protein n=1 Tax=uncultured alpha proteobacterium HF0070_14E07 TaxID=710804 RepID=E0XS57_9PROT|nr:hypothetical protein [uncultured alpha proteobacterium HF0070_14E07]
MSTSPYFKTEAELNHGLWLTGVTFQKSQQFGVSRLWLSFSITSGKINL